jgi:LuxR family transcriptional regulator of spore coat protein
MGPNGPPHGYWNLRDRRGISAIAAPHATPNSDPEPSHEDHPLKTTTKGSLTSREREVVGWLAQGKTVADAALILGISTKTAECHSTNAARKLGTENRAELVVAAIREGLVPCPCPQHGPPEPHGSRYAALAALLSYCETEALALVKDAQGEVSA